MESNLMNGYTKAYKVACESMKMFDWNVISRNTGSKYDTTTSTLLLKYLGGDYLINCSTGEVKALSYTDEVTTTVKILMLHYLMNTGIRPLSGKLISFLELENGTAIYYDTFHKRAVLPLLKAFERSPETLKYAGKMMGGIVERFGTSSVRINIFPMVPVTYVIWQGDEETGSSATILFDETVSDYLPGEDIVLAASFGAYELIKYAAKGD